MRNEDKELKLRIEDELRNRLKANWRHCHLVDPVQNQRGYERPSIALLPKRKDDSETQPRLRSSEEDRQHCPVVQKLL